LGGEDEKSSVVKRRLLGRPVEARSEEGSQAVVPNPDRVVSLGVPSKVREDPSLLVRLGAHSMRHVLLQLH